MEDVSDYLYWHGVACRQKIATEAPLCSFPKEKLCLTCSLRAALVQRANISFVCSLVCIRTEAESFVFLFFIDDTVRYEGGGFEGQCFTVHSNKQETSHSQFGSCGCVCGLFSFFQL